MFNVVLSFFVKKEIGNLKHLSAKGLYLQYNIHHHLCT